MNTAFFRSILSSIVTRIRSNSFPLLLGIAVVILQILVLVAFRTAQTNDRVWLGGTIINAGDTAVYLNYIEQGRRGAIVLKNFFAPPDAGAYWHSIYIPLGWAARALNISSFWAFESARWLAILFAVCLLYAIAKASSQHDRDARWITGFMVFGGGFGWMYVIWQSLHGFFPSDFTVPDVSIEAFFFPTSTIAPHIILSFALLPFALLQIWRALNLPGQAKKIGPVALFFLLFIHPYFTPIIGLSSIIMTFLAQTSWKQRIVRILPFAVTGILAIVPHVHVHITNPSRRFLLEKNFVPLLYPWAWVFALLPWIILIALRARERLDRRDYWLIAWIIAIILALFLPIEWKRKLVQDIGVVFILLASPSVLRLRDRLVRMGWIPVAAGWLFVAFSPLLLVQSEIAWAQGRASKDDVLYTTPAIMNAWKWIQANTDEHSIVLTDDVWIGNWTPVYAYRHVWIGHNYETPVWEEKLAKIDYLFDPKTIKPFSEIDETNANVLLITSRETSEHLEKISENSEWTETFNEDAISVWMKREGMGDVSP